MTEEEDEDFYVRYYVVRAFFSPPPRVSLSLSLSCSTSFFFSHFVRQSAISIFPIAKLCVYIFYAFVSPSLSLSLRVSDVVGVVVILFFTQGHKGKFGHEFLEFEFKPNGKLRYANNSNYKGDKCIRKEMCVSKAGECIFF